MLFYINWQLWFSKQVKWCCQLHFLWLFLYCEQKKSVKLLVYLLVLTLFFFFANLFLCYHNISFRDIYPKQLELHSQNGHNAKTNFIDLSTKIKVSYIGLFDKSYSFPFKIIRISEKSSNTLKYILNVNWSWMFENTL